MSSDDPERFQGFDDTSRYLLRRMAHWAGISRGFRETWRALHDSAVEQGLAEGWRSEFGGSCGAGDRTPEAAVTAGFGDPYGECNSREDIASFTEVVRAGRLSGNTATVCTVLQRAPTPPPLRSLVPYAKIRLLEAAGFLEAEDVRACLGSYRLAQTSAPGIHLLDAMGNTTTRFGQSYVVGLERNYPAFVMAADNSTAEYQFFVRVEAPGRRFPLGLHRLYNVVDPALIPSGQNYMLLANRANNDRARVGAGGLVIYTQISPMRVEGMILFLELRGPLGTITDRFPYVPFGFTP